MKEIQFLMYDADEKVVVSILENTTQHGAIEGKTQTNSVKYYNLDAIISIGYRVNSQKAMKLRNYRESRNERKQRKCAQDKVPGIY